MTIKESGAHEVATKHGKYRPWCQAVHGVDQHTVRYTAMAPHRFERFWQD